MGAFIDLLNLYFPQQYSPVCLDIIKLPEETLNAIFDLQINNVKMEHIKFNTTFWKAFNNAVKNHPDEAILSLTQLQQKPVEEVEKLLKNIKPNLLQFLKKRGPHAYNSEEDALKDLSGGMAITTEVLINALRATNWLQNSKRDSSNWKAVKDKLTTYFKESLIYQNAKFVETIDEALISAQNFIVVQNPSTEMINILKKYEKNFTFIIIGNLGQEPQKFTDSEPTAIFDVILQHPPVIDQVIDFLPPTSTKVHLYIPCAPKSNETEKIRFLSKIAMTKKCPLATCWTMDIITELAKLATNYEKLMLYNTSFEVTKSFLSKLIYYREIVVTGNEEVKNLVASCLFKEHDGETNEQN